MYVYCIFNLTLVYMNLMFYCHHSFHKRVFFKADKRSSLLCEVHFQGRIQDLKLGGRALKKIARTFLGYFVWKITILRQKIFFFPILEGWNPHPDLPLISIALARPNTILLVVGEITRKIKYNIIYLNFLKIKLGMLKCTFWHYQIENEWVEYILGRYWSDDRIEDEGLTL